MLPPSLHHGSNTATNKRLEKVTSKLEKMATKKQGHYEAEKERQRLEIEQKNLSDPQLRNMR